MKNADCVVFSVISWAARQRKGSAFPTLLGFLRTVDWQLLQKHAETYKNTKYIVPPKEHLSSKKKKITAPVNNCCTLCFVCFARFETHPFTLIYRISYRTSVISSSITFDLFVVLLTNRTSSTAKHLKQRINYEVNPG